MVGAIVAVMLVTSVTWFCKNCMKRGPHDHWEDEHNEVYKCRECKVIQVYKK